MTRLTLDYRKQANHRQTTSALSVRVREWRESGTWRSQDWDVGRSLSNSGALWTAWSDWTQVEPSGSKKKTQTKTIWTFNNQLFCLEKKSDKKLLYGTYTMYFGSASQNVRMVNSSSFFKVSSIYSHHGKPGLRGTAGVSLDLSRNSSPSLWGNFTILWPFSSLKRNIFGRI